MRQKWQIATLPIHRYVAVSWASQAFGLPSTIRTCDLRLRSWKNELEQLVKQWDQGVGFWCGIHTENLGIWWKSVDPTWHLQAIGWFGVSNLDAK